MRVNIINSIKYLIIFIIFGQVVLTNSAKILSVSFFTSPSHRQAYEPLLNALIERGHDVTVISQVKPSNSNPKIREIPGITSGAFGEVNFFELRIKKTLMSLGDLSRVIDPICTKTYDLPEVRAVLSEKFDLIFVSAFMNECAFGFVHLLQAPYILIAPFPVFSTTASFFGVPVPTSFVSGMAPTPLTHKMNFWERSLNFVSDLALVWYSSYYFYPNAEGIYREKLGQDLPSVQDIGRNASMLFINSHFTITYPRPMMPDMIEFGGMHCKPSGPLPKDLEDFLNGSGDDSVIYFSLGSIVRANTMPESHRKMFINAFSKLKQRVLWKWETEVMDDLPPNVKLSKWLPQQDVLGHTNTRLFITHGGLLSTEEAVYHGVPLIGIPFFADQDWNMKQAESAGIAITLEIADLTEEKILEAINRIFNDHTYSKNVKDLSGIFKDRPQTALDTALFWTEYVIRHKGAHHLRSPARDLNIFQYNSLDVIAALVTVLITILYVVYASVKCSIRFIIGRLCGTNGKSASASTGHNLLKTKKSVVKHKSN